MESNTEQYEKIEAKLNLLASKLETNGLSRDWLPRQEVADFLGYQTVSMFNLERKGEFVTCKIGRRTFISRRSFEEFLDRHTTKTKNK